MTNHGHVIVCCYTADVTTNSYCPRHHLCLAGQSRDTEILLQRHRRERCHSGATLPKSNTDNWHLQFRVAQVATKKVTQS